MRGLKNGQNGGLVKARGGGGGCLGEGEGRLGVLLLVLLLLLCPPRPRVRLERVEAHAGAKRCAGDPRCSNSISAGKNPWVRALECASAGNGETAPLPKNAWKIGSMSCMSLEYL